MPVHIREIVLKTNVESKTSTSATATKPDQEKNFAELVKAAVSQVLEVLDDRKKR